MLFSENGHHCLQPSFEEQVTLAWCHPRWEVLAFHRLHVYKEIGENENDEGGDEHSLPMLDLKTICELEAQGWEKEGGDSKKNWIFPEPTTHITSYNVDMCPSQIIIY